MPITPLPALDRTSATFKTDVDTFFGTQIPTFCTEANALEAALNAIAAGGAMAIPYTFDSTTTDADPTSGKLRLSSATQNTSTVIRADLVGSDGSTWTSVIDTFDDSTSTVKGYIRLVCATNATKWLIFSVSALASPTGYKNITVSCVASSAASPFTNGDPLIMYFTRTGDKGDTGAAGGGGDNAVTLYSGNGHGSTNTKIRRFTTTLVSVGTAISYSDSATNGASFTINETGLYEIYYTEITQGSLFGLSVNSTQLTTNIDSVNIANRVALAKSIDTINYPTATLTRVLRLVAGDVVRPHTDGTPTLASDRIYFDIRKIG